MTELTSSVKRKLLWAVVWIAIGTYWLLMNHGIVPNLNLSFSRDWPAILIIIGVVLLLKALELVFDHTRSVDVEPQARTDEQRHILDALQRGEISAEDAATRLKQT